MSDTVSEIIALNRKCADFWTNAHGWAPPEAADLLSTSRLDWQVSLSETLKLWLNKPAENLSDGMLILAWVNLGALVEGTIKLMLSVYYNQYIDDIETLKATGLYDWKKQKHQEPDSLTFEKLRAFVVRKGLFKHSDIDADKFLIKVRDRRNAIHAYKNRPIGDTAEFKMAVTDYLKFLQVVEGRLPYP